MRRALTLLLTLGVMFALPAAMGAQDHPPRPEEQLQDSTTGRAGEQADEHQNQNGLAQAAAGVSAAWLEHNAANIVANSPQLVIQLPGADPSAALSPPQAAALLSDFLAAAREVEVVVRGAREVEPGRGFVELVRRYRVNGTQDIRVQSLFLGYRREQQGWVLVELRAIEP